MEEMEWYREGMFKEKKFGCQASKKKNPGWEWMTDVCEEEGMGRSQGCTPDFDEMPQLWVATAYMKPLKGGSPSMAETTTYRT